MPLEDNMSRLIKAACIFTVLLFCLCGCGKKESSQTAEATEERGVNMVSVKKDGVITNTIEEAFEAEYLDEDSLKQFVLQEAAEYNGDAGSDRIGVKKLEIKKNNAVLTMEYRTAEDFSAFNEYPFFYGTVAEAYAAGYELDGEFLEAGSMMAENTDEEIPSIQKDQLLEMGSRKIIIAQVPEDENLTIKTSGKILYISGASLEKKNIAVVGNDREGVVTTYIVFK